MSSNIKETTHKVILPIIQVNTPDQFGKLHTVNALIDSGSMSNFISERLSKKLHLPREYTSCVEIQGLNSMTSLCKKGSIHCSVQPIHSHQPSFQFKAIITPSICSNQPSISSITSMYSHLKHLNINPDKNLTTISVDLLLGAELVPQIFTDGRIQGGPNEPIAVNSVFGWIIMGKSSISNPNHHSTCLSTTNASLEKSIQRFWELESIPKETSLSKSEEMCESHFKKNCQLTSSGRFMVSLPFKTKEPVLGNSYTMALKRFLSLENRLLKNPALKDDYVKFMKDYLESNHMTRLSLLKSPSEKSYYIPHHCIVRPESLSTKLRVVFDASAITSNGISLNDNLLIGRKLQQDIVKILMSFRCFNYAFICDIKQMYRQILISPSDRPFQKILWRFSPAEPIEEYCLNTVTYGVASAPFLALRTLLELANKYENYYPRAATVLRNHVYVDDIVAGAQSINEALKVQQELIDLLRKGSFELRKWASNCKEILRFVSNTDLSMPISLNYDDTHCVKVLGLLWNPTSDQFQYSFSSRQAPCTKRSILSEIARIYDPLGFLTPCTLKAKIYMQQLWQLKISWDETPPLHVTENWKTFKNNLPVLSEWSLPRLMIPIKTQSVQLHLFCDASQQGYCTVAYLRSQTDTSITTSFICAKARVAPLKTISIPRLELCGAVLLADMLQNIKETLSPLIEFKSITAWSDSQVTLAWIASTPSRWKVFVANRVSHINNILPSTSWRYIPSSSNPADCGSRGMFPDQLIATELWWKGPSWLNKSPEYWPSINKIPETEDILREQQQKFVQTTEIKTNIIDILLNKFSSLSKIQRILAYIQRFLSLCQRQKGCSGINLSLFEVQQALTTMLRHVQNQHFSSLFISIKNNQLPPKPLRKLAPFIDREGLIRVGGRLKYAVIPFDHKHPVLLPKTNRVSELLVEELHKKHLHVGQRTLQSLMYPLRKMQASFICTIDGGPASISSS
nr:uncharacterized protein LOC111429551 [Onthophagus taurus]